MVAMETAACESVWKWVVVKAGEGGVAGDTQPTWEYSILMKSVQSVLSFIYHLNTAVMNV